MTYTIAMDSAGRLVLPKAVRERYGLAGAPQELELTDTSDGIVLRPKASYVPVTRDASGWVIFHSDPADGGETDPVALIEQTREERDRQVTGRE